MLRRAASPLQCLLGLCYQEGIVLVRDRAKGLNLVKMAAENGYAPAQYHITMHYLYGIGVKKNVETGLEYYNKAARQEFGPALCQLGFTYEAGVIVKQDLRYAMIQLKIAVARGDIRAKAALADRYFDGVIDVNHPHTVFLKRDVNKGLALLKEAAAEGHHIAQTNLARFYQHNSTYVARDIKRAIELYQLSAVNEYGEAYMELGKCYWKEPTPAVGITDIVMYQISLLLFQKASRCGNHDQDHIVAKYMITKDFPTLHNAIARYAEPALNDDVNAVYILGVCYHLGLGTETDLTTAEAHYRKAFALGRHQCLWDLLCIFKLKAERNLMPVENILAFFNDLLANEETDIKIKKEATYCFGHIYEYGIMGPMGLTPDLLEALQHYTSASQMGAVPDPLVSEKIERYTPLLIKYQNTVTCLNAEFTRSNVSMPPALVNMIARYSTS